MKILITVGHPGHIHFYKNFVWTAQKKDMMSNFDGKWIQSFH